LRPQHVFGVLFQNATGARFQFVHYRGGAPDRHGERTKAAIAERQKFSSLLKTLRAGLI
jgi:hypothetical protein